jgi:Protein of unknown function, DUF547
VQYCRLFVVAVVAVVLLCPVSSLGKESKFDHKHARFSLLLSQIAQDGKVDYVKLRRNPEQLGNYLKTMSKVTRKQFERFSVEQRIAYWVNLYNATILDIVVKNYPIMPKEQDPHYPRNSIRQIAGVWTKVKVGTPLGKMTLTEIEARPLAKFKEPRIWLVLVNSAEGGPKLGRKALVAKNLNQQLEEAARSFVLDPQNCTADADRKKLVLNQLFQWKGPNFVPRYYKHGQIKRSSKTEIALVVFLVEHVRPMQKMFILQEEFEIEFKPFDWSLNER